jgi:competence protein ComEA
VRVGWQRRRGFSLGLALLCALPACSAVWAQSPITPTELNTANQAELEMVKGVGPALSALVLQQRESRLFRDWDDTITRLPGIGPARARKLSDAGLRVNGSPYEPHKAASASAVSAASVSR